MKSGNVVLGVLAGVAIGAALGILLAPDSGSNIRRKFTEKSDDYIDGLEEKFNDLIDTLKQKYADAKEQGGDMVKDAAGMAEKELSKTNGGQGNPGGAPGQQQV